MKFKKILPITTVLATTSVAATLAVSCASPSKGLASWTYSDGIYNFKNGKAATVAAGINNDTATETYFKELEQNKVHLAEDIVWKISNEGYSISISLETLYGKIDFSLVPLSAKVLVTDAKYDGSVASDKHGVVSYDVTYGGYVDIKLTALGTTTELHTYADGTLNFTDIILYADFNETLSKSKYINCWNITNSYSDHQGVHVLPTSKIAFKMNIPAEATTYWFNFNSQKIQAEDPIAMALMEAMSPQYSNYLSNNTLKD